jgi:hypothetical protein
MRRGILILCLLLAGCITTPQKGGRSVQVLPPQVVQEMVQPDNPEGESRQVVVRVTQHPDGTVVTERAETALGGSQDLAAIVRAASSTNALRGAFIAVFLTLGATVAFSKGWPIVGVVLIGGGVSSLLFAWWAGLLAIAAAFLINYAYNMGAFTK